MTYESVASQLSATAPGPLKLALKELLIRVANLSDVTPQSIADQEPLFGAGLGLDSIDMLEVVVYIEKGTGLKIRNTDEGRVALSSVENMAEAILQHRATMAQTPEGAPEVLTPTGTDAVLGRGD